MEKYITKHGPQCQKQKILQNTKKRVLKTDASVKINVKKSKMGTESFINTDGMQLIFGIVALSIYFLLGNLYCIYLYSKDFSNHYRKYKKKLLFKIFVIYIPIGIFLPILLHRLKK